MVVRSAVAKAESCPEACIFMMICSHVGEMPRRGPDLPWQPGRCQIRQPFAQQLQGDPFLRIARKTPAQHDRLRPGSVSSNLCARRPSQSQIGRPVRPCRRNPHGHSGHRNSRTRPNPFHAGWTARRGDDPMRPLHRHRPRAIRSRSWFRGRGYSWLVSLSGRGGAGCVSAGPGLDRGAY